MVRFLTDEWLRALDDAARSAVVPHDLVDEVVVEQVVRTDRLGTRRWHLLIGPSGVRVVGGAAQDPVITMFTDEATATSIAQGTLNAQQALDSGTLKLRGDLDGLVALRSLFLALGDLFGSVRDSTDWTPTATRDLRSPDSTKGETT